MNTHSTRLRPSSLSHDPFIRSRLESKLYCLSIQSENNKYQLQKPCKSYVLNAQLNFSGVMGLLVCILQRDLWYLRCMKTEEWIQISCKVETSQMWWWDRLIRAGLAQEICSVSISTKNNVRGSANDVVRTIKVMKRLVPCRCFSNDNAWRFFGIMLFVRISLNSARDGLWVLGRVRWYVMENHAGQVPLFE